MFEKGKRQTLSGFYPKRLCTFFFFFLKYEKRKLIESCFIFIWFHVFLPSEIDLSYFYVSFLGIQLRQFGKIL